MIRQGSIPALRRFEPVIGHDEEEHRIGRNYLAHADGDAINTVLAASVRWNGGSAEAR